MGKIDKRQAILDQYPDETFLFADGFDAAILGVAGGFDEHRVVYSVSRILEILVEEYRADGEAEDPDYDWYTMAREYADFNIFGGYVGPQTPIFIEDEMMEDYEHESIMEGGPQDDLGVAACPDGTDGRAGSGTVPALPDGDGPNGSIPV